jgi:hypothetical protein
MPYPACPDRRSSVPPPVERVPVLPDEPIFHVCLAGHKVTGDHALIRRLKVGHAVTLVESVEALRGAPLLKTARVLVLDCTGCGERVPLLLHALKEQFPSLCVLLVEGTYDQKQLAGAFRNGVRDCFPAPYDLHLLAERIAALCVWPVGHGPRSATDRSVPPP